MNELDVYRFDFKKTWFGGYDKLDVLNKVKDLNERYQGIMQNQKEYYEAKIAELEKQSGKAPIYAAAPVNSIGLAEEEKKKFEDELFRQRIHYENIINSLTATRADINQDLLDEQKKKYEEAILKLNNLYDEKIDEYQDRIENVVSFTLELIGKKVDEINSDNIFSGKQEISNLMNLKKDIDELKSDRDALLDNSYIIKKSLDLDDVDDKEQKEDRSKNKSKNNDEDEFEFSKMMDVEDEDESEVNSKNSNQELALAVVGKRGRRKKKEEEKEAEKLEKKKAKEEKKSTRGRKKKED